MHPVLRMARGLGSLLLLVILLIAVPIGLWIVGGGSPVPADAPGLDQVLDVLTRPDDGTIFLRLLGWVAWLAWASFAAMVVAEIVARLRGASLPQIRGLGLQQRAAAGLIGAVIALGATGPLASANAAPSESAVSAAAVVAEAPTAAHNQDGNDRSQAVQAEERRSQVQTRVHNVVEGESLYSIAEQVFDDGDRWRELAELNYDRAQPGGGALDHSHWLQPGWKLLVPVVDQVTVTPGMTLSDIAAAHLGDADRWPELAEINDLADADQIQVGQVIHLADDAGRRHSEQHGPAVVGEHPGARTKASGPRSDAPQVEAEESPPATSTGGRGEASPERTATAAAESSEEESEQPSVRTVAGTGAVLAAGIVGVLALRRRAQQRRRRPGAAMALPTGATAAAESELRAVADPVSVAVVDRALRALARDCIVSHQALPRVKAARLTSRQFDLFLAEPASMPEPWCNAADQRVWTLTRSAVEKLPPIDGLAEVPAPYPALVVVGHDVEDGHVLVDLEHLGELGIEADTDTTRQIMAALAVELATSRWADDLQVTIVGSYAELEGALETGRCRYLPSIGVLLQQLHARAEADRAALSHEDVRDLSMARVSGQAADAWTPEILLIPGWINDEQRAQLHRLVTELPRVAVAAVTGESRMGEWSLTVTAPPPSPSTAAHTSPEPSPGALTADLKPLGLQLRPQILTDAEYQAVLEALIIADDQSDATTPDWDGHAEPDLGTAVGTGVESEESEDADLRDDMPVAGADVVDDVHDLPLETVEETAAKVIDFPMEPLAASPRGPRLLLLGSVDIIGVDDNLVEPSRRSRLTELATILHLHPGCDHTRIDACYYPGKRVSDNTRNTQTSKLRRWLGQNHEGEHYLPRYRAGDRYRLHDDVTSDWDDWQALLVDGIPNASTEDLEQAVALVRGRPFDQVPARRYAWAEHIQQEMVAQIRDATYELSRRQIWSGAWSSAETTTLIGLLVEPGTEALWRLRITAVAGQRNSARLSRVVEQLLATAEEWGGDLEPATESLLELIRRPDADIRSVIAGL